MKQNIHVLFLIQTCKLLRQQVINTVDFHNLEYLDNHTLYSRIIHHLPELFISVVISSLVELDNVL